MCLYLTPLFSAPPFPFWQEAIPLPAPHLARPTCSGKCGWRISSTEHLTICRAQGDKNNECLELWKTRRTLEMPENGVPEKTMERLPERLLLLLIISSSTSSSRSSSSPTPPALAPPLGCAPHSKAPRRNKQRICVSLSLSLYIYIYIQVYIYIYIYIYIMYIYIYRERERYHK